MISQIESQRLVNGFTSFSQAHQDLFVRYMLDFKKNGYYLEIGGGEPKQSNNSYVLERDLNWKGVSLDLDPELVFIFNSARKNPCVNDNAILFSYDRYLTENCFPNQIDYLSLDIDPAINTYNALRSIPHDSYRFSDITYEHDNYIVGPEFMLKSRAFLEDLGYLKIVSNVHCCGRDFEDWWVDPNVVPKERYDQFVSQGLECGEIFKNKVVLK